jgi:alpha-tubulin suppressor-like RCC1 family protein
VGQVLASVVGSAPPLEAGPGEVLSHPSVGGGMTRVSRVIALSLGGWSWTVPAAVAQDPGPIQVATSTHHTLVVMPDGSLWCQGINRYNQCGQDAPSDTGLPGLMAVQGVPRIVAVSLAGPDYSMALGVDGRVYLWGRSLYGVLGGDGRNREEQVDRPSPVQGMGRSTGIAACDQAAAALAEDGSVWMWGSDEGGVMATGRVNDRYESAREYHAPVRVQGVDDVVQIACGAGHMLALKRDGSVWAWGQNRAGQLGLGDVEPRGVPTRIPSLSGVRWVYAAHGGSAARLEDGTWRWWGGTVTRMRSGCPDSWEPVTEPTPLPGVLATANDLANGIARLPDGTILTWGDNTFGFLGTGQSADMCTERPVRVPSLSNMEQVWSEGGRAVALGADGTLYRWGPTGIGGGSPDRVPVVLGRVR